MFQPPPSSTFTAANSSHDAPNPATTVDASGDKKGHKRVYQACQSCRNHKTKCDRGSVDDPDPTCRRCRREGKVCEIADTRRRKPRRSSFKENGENNDFGNGDHVAKRVRLASAATVNSETQRSGTLGPSVPTPASFGSGGGRDEHITTQSSEILQRNPVDEHSNVLTTLAHVEVVTGRSSANEKPGPVGSITNPPGRARNVAIAAWKRLSFIRDGLLAPEEAIYYVQKFYEELRPLTPITIEDYKDQESHDSMISTEPMLTITILAISSRYFLPAAPNDDPGPRATSRAYEIHMQLWQHLQNLTSRMLWAQDFGGDDIRTLGAVESLLLMTEFATRGVHLPPSDTSNGLFAPRQSHSGISRSSSNTGDSDIGGPRKSRIDGWLDSCHRTDRMCWSLINLAISIAIEIGVFDPNLEIIPSTLRGQYCGRLLHIYMHSTSERLKLAPSLPSLPPHLQDIVERRSHDPPAGEPEGQESHVLWHWSEINRVLLAGNEAISVRKDGTGKLISSGDYEQVVKNIDKQWEAIAEKINRCVNKVVLEQRKILNLELQYARVRINSIALQAIVERVVAQSVMRQHSSITAASISEAIGDDRRFIHNIVTASLSFLQTVQTFTVDGKLKYLPVRSFFRIVAVSMMLIRCFYMGLNHENAAQSLTLLHQVSAGLRDNVVDDLHVGSRIGELLVDLLETLSEKLREFTNTASAVGAGAGAAANSTANPTYAPPVSAQVNAAAPTGFTPLHRPFEDFDPYQNVMIPWDPVVNGDVTADGWGIEVDGADMLDALLQGGQYHEYM